MKGYLFTQQTSFSSMLLGNHTLKRTYYVHLNRVIAVHAKRKKGNNPRSRASVYSGKINSWGRGKKEKGTRGDFIVTPL